MIYLASCLSFVPYVFLHIAISLSLSWSNGASYLLQMVRTRTGDFALDMPESLNARARAAATRPQGPAPELPPPPPPSPMSLEQLLAMQNELMWVLTENLMHCGVHQSHHQPVLDSSYTDFLAMHPPMFAEAADALEADNWLHIIESMFGLLHCTESQKTLYMAQQLRGSASAWWANFTATLQDDHQVSWAEFREAFHGHHIPSGLMAHKF
jgi:hypothetical protein